MFIANFLVLKCVCNRSEKIVVIPGLGNISVDELSATPYNSMDKEQLELYQSHSRIGQAALLSISALDKTGQIILAHHEHYNGKGFPDGMSGEKIPLGARILAVASDFDDLQNGIYMGDQFTAPEAVTYIKEQSGIRYDLDVVNAFQKITESTSFKMTSLKELKVDHEDLEPGMVLTKNITSASGMLLLREGQVLNDSLIERIHKFIKDAGASKVIYVSGTRAEEVSGER